MNNADFKPAWWLCSPHLQTLWPVFFKKRHLLNLAAEQVELDDGDFIDLRWSKINSDKTVLVLHGLEGSLESHYINGIMFQLEQSGYKPVLMHFRGCGGRMNSTLLRGIQLMCETHLLGWHAGLSACR